jgi:transposase
LLAAKRDGDLIAKRGNWLRRTFVCRSLSIDPAVAEMLGELLVGLSRVEIVKKRNTEAACSGCHALIDPVGIGFVQFDAAGRFDATIDGSVYGVASRLPDAANPAFATIAELAGKLQAMPEVSACMATKLFTYTEGREPVRADTCAVEAAAKGFAASSNDFSAMLKGLIADPSFRQRRAAGATP